MSRTTDFDKEKILQKATNLFWAKGYEGTSLSDLTEATGILKGSLYNTFKSKEYLFLLCLENYGNYSRSFFYKEEENPKTYLKRFFTRLTTEGIDPEKTNGCLIMNSCLEFSGKAGAPATRTTELFEAVEANFENVVKSISKNSTINQDKLKASLITAAFSIREFSKFKKDKKFLKQIANNALEDLKIKI